MAAIIPFLEADDQVLTEPTGPALAGLADGRHPPEHKEFSPLPLARTHTELTQTYWTRRALETEVAKRHFRVDQDGEDFWIYFLDDKGNPWPLAKETVPWSQLPGKDGGRLSLLSTNNKMRCPTWDLPAGAFTLGGTCPASSPAQTTSTGFGPDGKPKKSALPIWQPDGREAMTTVVPDRAVCQYCYASGSAYKYASTQMAEVARYQLVRALLKRGEAGRKQFLELMVAAITAAKYNKKVKGQEDLSARFGIKPVRVHSSGDFFSTEYAAWWIDVAVELAKIDPAYRLWAPTRTHTTANFRRFWPDALKRIPLVANADGSKVPNFTIRASGYHIGDTAPRMPGEEGPTVSRGTSVLSPADSVRYEGEYYDHQCGVYALDDGNKTCAVAAAPDGKPGCRACWIAPKTRVNYVVH